jgi:hypothetical protein
MILVNKDSVAVLLSCVYSKKHGGGGGGETHYFYHDGIFSPPYVHLFM